MVRYARVWSTPLFFSECVFCFCAFLNALRFFYCRYERASEKLILLHIKWVEKTVLDIYIPWVWREFVISVCLSRTIVYESNGGSMKRLSTEIIARNWNFLIFPLTFPSNPVLKRLLDMMKRPAEVNIFCAQSTSTLYRYSVTGRCSRMQSVNGATILNILLLQNYL